MLSKFFQKIRFAPADAATALNLVCGFLSILMTANGQPVQAIWLIVMAMVFDSIDGNLAKIFNTVSDFGRELDSLSDMVSFGVAPAFLFSMTFIQPEFSFLAFGIPAAYAVCAAVRLARFNVRAPVRGYFHGLPSPSAALGAAMLMLVAMDRGWTELPVFENAALTVMGALAFLMVSSVPYPKPFGAEYKRWKPFFGLATVATFLVGIILDRDTAFLAAMMLYIVGCPFQVISLNKKVAPVLS
ncbi:MAG TPA: CDP-diacylglycerol--serine O-phosphatidyltransferase [Candidatus Omnitrophica bacterium]|nr:CDP-diacylglycerol--serine O-phosphatidyltransferase [Candidatus Omnitrophota bacterium]